MSNRWDERYRQGEYGDKEPDPLVVHLATRECEGDALDLACGLGRHALWLASHGWRVTAIDYSRVALGILRERAADLTVDIVRADLEVRRLPFRPESYDLICDCNFLWRPLFPELRGALRPGGLFVGIYPLAGQAGNRRPSNPDYLIQRGELVSLFDGWEIVHLCEGQSRSGRLRAEIAARRPKG